MFDIVLILNIVIGLLLVLFVPGFALSFAFFPKKELKRIERFTISVALSISTVPLTIFYLNKFFDVKINLINSVITIIAIAALGVAIWYFRTKGCKLRILHKK